MFITSTISPGGLGVPMQSVGNLLPKRVLFIGQSRGEESEQQ